MDLEIIRGWTTTLILTITALQLLKFYLNIYTGEQFYPNAISYDDKMRKRDKNGRDLIEQIPKNDRVSRTFYDKNRQIKGWILYPRYIYFFIPFWISLPKTKKGKMAAYFVLGISLVQLLEVIILVIINGPLGEIS